MDANGHLRATDEDVVDGDVDELDNVANDTCHVSVMEPYCFGGVAQHSIPMIRKPMPTACEMRMNSFLSGSVEGQWGSLGSMRVYVLVQRFMKRVPSLRNSAGILRTG
jgi:hypothetical protein